MVLKERDAMLLQRDRNNNSNRQQLAPAPSSAPTPAPSSKQPQPTGRFHALLDDDDDAISVFIAQPGASKRPVQFTVPVEFTVPEQFPALGFKSVTTSSTQGGRAWAQMAANAANLPIPIPKHVTHPIGAPERDLGYYYSSDEDEDNYHNTLDNDAPIYTSSGWDDDTW
jgi:hypothetical protein